MRLNRSLTPLFLLLVLFIYSCGIDERSQREKENEKKQTMDSLFKDADKIPVIEEEIDTTSTNP